MATETRGRRRRPSGDRDVYRTDHGRWRGVVDLGWIDGRRRRKYVGGATQAQVLERVR